MYFSFPRWTNRFAFLAIAGLGASALYLCAVVYAATAPETLSVGHAPKQPIPFSHRIHAGQLKMDCRYCHNTVDKAAHAAIPPSATCANCHSGASENGSVKFSSVRSESPALALLRQSVATQESIPWKRVHDLPDYVYFDHSAHVNRGVSCVSCHGRVDQMDVVTQEKTLSMTFCLECHRNPEEHLRPVDKVTDLAWVPETSAKEVGHQVKSDLGINPRTSCSTCHR
ncbi:MULTISPECIES: cytochrome c3 family protein [unclassified Schlesneria]|uniref:cytochrome c3 family protein n=1 Tax=Schlesneria TaxID=656899 RepID=UPI0035A17566